MTAQWRCKDCKMIFATYEATAAHVRDTHQRKPRSKDFSETMGLFDDLGKALGLKH